MNTSHGSTRLLPLLLAAVACSDPAGPMEDPSEALAKTEPQVVLIDFERLPDGSIPCAGAGICGLADDYAELGVIFNAENGHPNCGADRVWNTQVTLAYDAPGSAQNRAATNSCSVGYFSVELAAAPDTVDFVIWMNDDVDVEVEAHTADGTRLPAGAVAREAHRYTTGGGFTFRRERVRIVSSSGIGTFGWSTSYFGVFLDDILFTK